MKKNIFTLALIALSGILSSQTLSRECGNQKIDSLKKTYDSMYVSRVLKLNDDINNYIATNFGPGARPISTTAQYVIPVVVHIVLDPGDAINNSTITYAQVEDQIDALNAAFAMDYPAYNGQSHGSSAVDSRIQFCLAKATIGAAAWTNTLEPGVMRYSDAVNSHNLMTIASTNSLVGVTHPTPAYFPFTKCLNIWVVNSIDGNCSGTQGYAINPLGIQIGITGFNIDGVVIRADAFGDNSTGSTYTLQPHSLYGTGCPTFFAARNQGKVLVHEVGHYLNLWHTFENDLLTGSTCAGSTTATCNSSGDFCCDTPPSNISSTFICGSSNPNSCGVPDMIENYMYYAFDACQNTFTTDQRNRMWACLNILRPGLFAIQSQIAAGIIGNSSGCLPAILYDRIDVSNTMCVPTASTAVISNPVGAFNSATSWSWSIPGASPSTATTASFTASFPSAGIYTISLTVSDGTNTPITNTLLVAVTSCSISANYLAQANWFFGSYASIDFTSGLPVPTNTAWANMSIVALEGCVSVSDNSGNLLYYAGNQSIWDNTHSAVITGLPGHTSTSQYLGVPDPANPNRAYVLIPPTVGSANQMVAQHITTTPGVSAVSQLTLALPSGVSLSELVTAVPHCNGTDYWIITHGMNNSFYVYRLSSLGFTNATLSGSSPDIYTFSGIALIGSLKASPDGKRIAMATALMTVPGLYIYNFDNTTGIITNEIVLSTANHYGCSFSPNSQILYASEFNFGNLSRYDLVNNVSVLNMVSGCFTPQIGLNGRIYISNTGFISLHSLDNPDSFSNPLLSLNSVNFLPVNINIQGLCGLPNMIDAMPAPTVPAFTYSYNTCSTIDFTSISCATPSLITWDFGDGSSMVTGATASHTYSASMPYTVTCTFPGSVTVSHVVNITGSSLSISGPTTTCRNNNTPYIYSTSLVTGATYTWSASGNGTILGTPNGSQVNAQWNSGTTGTISVTMVKDGCTRTGSLSVTINSPPSISIAAYPSTVCATTPSSTLTAAGGITYVWAPGLSTINPLIITPTITSTYSVTGTDINGCSGTGTVIVTVNPSATTAVSVNSTTLCLGNTATLTASGASTYSWNTGASTNTLAVSPTNTTIYTVTGTSTVGCIATAQATVSVFTPVISPSSTLICSAGSATLTASGGSTYTWSPSGNNTNTLVVTPTVSTTYTVSSTFAGCTATAAVTVSTTALPSVTVTNSVSVVCNAAASFTASASPSGSSYSWQVWDATMTSTLSAPVTGATASVSSVDFTGIFQPANVCATATSTNGCRAVSCATVLSCCQTPTNTVHYTNAGFAFHTVLSGTASVLYQFSGTITVSSGTLEISEADVTLDPYTVINVSNNAYLRINESYLHGCGSVWRSIVAQGNATVEVTGSWIEDGIEALVDTAGGATFIVNGNYFNRNVIGIMARATKTNTSSFNIKNNLFTCSALPVPTPFPYVSTIPSATMAPALYGYAPARLAAPYQGMGSGAGIYLQNARQTGATEAMIPIGSVNNGEENIFDKLQVGVVVQRSSALLQNNFFQNIKFSTNPGAVITGVHVQSNATLNASQTSTVQLGGSPSTLRNTFVDCERGLLSVNRNRLNITNNTFSVQTTAIQMENNYNGDNVYISTNKFTACEKGISFYNNAWVNAVITDNRFDNSAGAVGSYSTNVAITLGEPTMPLGNPTNYGNYLANNNLIDGYYNGIYAINTHRTDLTENEVHMRADNTSMHTQAGIRVDGSSYTIAYLSTVDMATLTATSGDWQAGIWYNSVQAPLINCNNIDKVATSLRISGPCNTLAFGNVFLNNEFSNANSGIWMDGGDFNADQALWSGTTPFACDNQWSGTMTQRTLATGSGGNFSNSILHTQSGTNFNVTSGNSLALGSANALLGSNSDLSNGITCFPQLPTPSFRTGRPTARLFARAQQIADGSLFEGKENSENLEQLNKKYLFGNIMVQQADVSEDNLLSTFVQDIKNSNTGALCKVDSLLQLAGLEGDSLGSAALVAQHANNAVSAQNTMEQNQVLVNSAYLSMLGAELSHEQIEQLRVLALQCPDVAGHAVFQARAILMGIDHIIYTSNCNSSDNARKNLNTTSSLSTVKVYPNPTDNEFKTEMVLSETQNAIIELYNIFGSLVKTQVLHNGVTTMDIETLNSGTYFYTIKINGKVAKQDKLIIIK